jgi:hypothetical protein
MAFAALFPNRQRRCDGDRLSPKLRATWLLSLNEQLGALAVTRIEIIQTPPTISINFSDTPDPLVD